MPKTAPPKTTKAGHLHGRPAAGTRSTASFDLPISAPPTLTGPLDGLDAPLKMLKAPQTAADVPTVVAAALDGGRLHAPKLVAAAGFEPASALEADCSIEGRVRLRAGVTRTPVVGSTKAHLDRAGRISVTGGLRAHLGIDANAHVLAWVEPVAIGTSTIVSIVAAGSLSMAFDALAEQHRTASLPAPLNPTEMAIARAMGQ